MFVDTLKIHCVPKESTREKNTPFLMTVSISVFCIYLNNTNKSIQFAWWHQLIYMYLIIIIFYIKRVNIKFLEILCEIWKITDSFLFDPRSNSLQVFYGLGNAILKYFTRFDLWNDKDETIKLISWTEQITKTSDQKPNARQIYMLNTHAACRFLLKVCIVILR